MSSWPGFPTQGQQDTVLAQELSRHDPVFITAAAPHLASCSSVLRLWESEMGGAGWSGPEGRSLNAEGLESQISAHAPPQSVAFHFLHYHVQHGYPHFT